MYRLTNRKFHDRYLDWRQQTQKWKPKIPALIINYDIFLVTFYKLVGRHWHAEKCFNPANPYSDCPHLLPPLQSLWGILPALSPPLLPPPPPKPPAPQRSWLTQRAATTAPPPQRRSLATPATCPHSAQLTRMPTPTLSRASLYLQSQPPATHPMSLPPCPALPCSLRPVSPHITDTHQAKQSWIRIFLTSS